MSVNNLRKKDKVIELFCDLAEIPSPPFKEEEVSKFILEIFSIYGISAKLDHYKNVIAKIPATSKCKNAKPILLSAHMDVVGGSEEVKLCVSDCGNFIETDKTRTLGADDKAGVAAIMQAVIEICDLSSGVEHGPIEVIFTRDEEYTMTGIKELDTTQLASKYAIVCDGEKLGNIDIAGGGYTNIHIKVHGAKGGHSGLDIDDPSRINAIKVMSELDCLIPQGPYKKNENGVVTSINAANSISGSAGLFLGEQLKEAAASKKTQAKFSNEAVMQTVSREAATNIISQEAYNTYSIRSSEPENEKELIKLIKKHADDLMKKYENRIKIEVIAKNHLKPFVESKDTTLLDIIQKSAQNIKIKTLSEHFHAGAETHILANEKLNLKNEKFLPLLVGVANIYNMHSSNEYLDWKSLIRGRDWIKSIIIEFARDNEY